MQKKGIWLLDASIIGIYGNKESHGWVMDKEDKKRIILSCWDTYILNQITESKPKHIIVIGKSVEKILSWRLKSLEVKTGIKYTSLCQPQGLRTEEKIKNAHKEYQRICSKYALIS